ncbi:MAG: peptidyl-prolyl cis-trans isomerase [Ignavibacteriae bacterium]|nr:peptidyl-prolyl cis-trans isomerase [Ignavibacteriota bacterium]
MKYVKYVLFFIVPIILASCRPHKTSDVIARVGDAELSLEEALAHIDTTQGNVNQALQQYVLHWINNELLYQEAKQTGIVNSETFIHQLHDVQRMLAIQALLDRSIYNDTLELSEQSFHDYYQQHTSEFTLREEVMKLNRIVFKTRDHASRFAASVAQGGIWEKVLDRALSDSLVVSAVVSSTTAHYYTQQTLFPPELWKVAKALNMNEVSFPVRTSQGYAVLQLLSIARVGQQATYELVQEEVRQRFLMENCRIRYEDLLNSLRKQYRVEMMLDSLKPPVSL